MKALLIRHAHSSGQAPDAELTKLGHRQARALTHVLSALAAGPLYASPYRRARDTLLPYAHATEQALVELDALHERILSPIPLVDWRRHIERSFTDPDYAPIGGESFMDVRRRLAGALRKIADIGGKRPTIVTHGNAIAALFQAADPSFDCVAWAELRNPDLFDVTLDDGRVTAFTRIEIAPEP